MSEEERKRPAPPSKFTSKAIAAIKDSLRRGSYHVTAAKAAGIGASTLALWLARGAAANARDEDDPHAKFYRDVQQIEAEIELELLDKVRAAKPGWQAAGWLLERRWVTRWSARVRTIVADQVDQLTSQLRGNPELHQQVVAVLGSEDAAHVTVPTEERYIAENMANKGVGAH